MRAAVAEVRGATKAFGQARVLHGVDLDVGEGEIVALLGPGPGAWIPPERRGVGLVFQDFALFPHLSVADNVGFGLPRRPAAPRRARIASVLTEVGLGELGARYPHELSGGQQQRVALARALAPSPRVLLMDEPFASLDAALRRRLRVELGALLRGVGVATLFVTHDQDEALSLADRVAVMSGGRLAQVGPPRELYDAPATVAVARAVGEANVLPGVAKGGRVRCALGLLAGRGPDGDVLVVVRPEALTLGGEGVAAQVIARDYVGREEIVHAAVAGLDGPLLVRAATDAPAAGRGCRLRVVGPVSWCPAP